MKRPSPSSPLELVAASVLFLAALDVCPAQSATTLEPSGLLIVHPPGVDLPVGVLARALTVTGYRSRVDEVITDTDVSYSFSSTITQTGPAIFFTDKWAFTYEAITMFQRGNLSPVMHSTLPSSPTRLITSPAGQTQPPYSWTVTNTDAWHAHEDSLSSLAESFTGRLVSEPDRNAFEEVVHSGARALGTAINYLEPSASTVTGAAAHQAIRDAYIRLPGYFRPNAADVELLPNEVTVRVFPGPVTSAATALMSLARQTSFADNDYFPFDDTDAPGAYLDTSRTEWASTQKVQYKFRLGPNPSATVAWMEVFTPKDSAQPKSYQFMTWQPSGGATESPTYTIDPLGLDPADTHRSARHPDQDGNYTVIILQAEIAVDANRDGAIKFRRQDLSDVTAATTPYRFWINDDVDSGDAGGTTDYSDGSNRSANYKDNVVNGTRDLVDFFPLCLDLQELLTVLPPSATVKYKLKQADSALNLAYTNLTRDTALDYHTKRLLTGFSDSFNRAPGAAATHQITAAGFELSSAFLAGVRDGDWGVLLIEGRATTTAPLVLSVEQAGTPIAEVKLELRISNVEDMFRHLDLTDLSREYNGTPVAPPVPVAPARAGDPGEPYPDSMTNGKYFVFVHGFNIDGRRARGWNAEVFKRLYQLGSHARFVGVTWNGATGQQLPSGSYTDYHQAVVHAFQTGDALADRLTSSGVTGDVTIAAHSLGNMVVSQAIQSGGFVPARYYLINAAVPLESYHLGSVGPGDVAGMTNTGWQDAPFSNGLGRLFAANWYLLFSGTGDHRSELTWKMRFSDVLENAYNFYSPGDEVVEDPKTGSPSLLLTAIRQGFSSSHGAWGLQELAKGTFSIASTFFSRTQAGWGQSITGKESPFDANPPSDSLKQEPFFASFKEPDLLSADPVRASALAGQKKVQYDVLARGIPALSFATAVHKLVPLNLSERNFNMETQGRTENQWPIEGHTKDDRDRGHWLHSDFKNVALPYVFKMYQEMINRGSLK